MFISEKNLDDALHSLLIKILDNGDRVSSTKGENIELLGVLVEIHNPRARLSRTETRGKPFSCLGELLWYLSGSDKLEFIEYYIPDYRKCAEADGTIRGAYGPRIFDNVDANQFHRVLDLLKKKPASRQGVIQIFSGDDIIEQQKDTPCTCTLQFFIRDERLHTIVCMRSNDAFLGFPHDVFAFTMLQEIMASSIGIDVGTYRHFAGSMHIYEKNQEDAKQFIDEGYQSTLDPMPCMPIDGTIQSVHGLLLLENELRKGGVPSEELHAFQKMPEYWQDIGRLLMAYRHFQNKDLKGLVEVQSAFRSQVFNLFVDRKIGLLKNRLSATLSDKSTITEMDTNA